MVRRLETGLTGTAVAFFLGFGAVACLASGFGLAAVPLAKLAVAALAAGLVFSLCFTCRLGLVPPCLLALTGGFLWHRGDLPRQFSALIFHITRLYNRAYGFPTLGYSGQSRETVQVSLALGAVMLLVVLAASWTVCRKKWPFYAIVPGIFPPALCLVVTDTPPAALPTATLLLGVLLVLFSQPVRRREGAAAGNRLAALLLLPLAAALGLLFWAVPKEGYAPPDVLTLVEALRQQTQELDFSQLNPPTPGNLTGDPGEKVNLAAVGPQGKSARAVMEVTASYGGSLYLRGRSFDSYNGKTWESTPAGDLDDWPGPGQLEPMGQVEIVTRETATVLYLPYYPDGGTWLAELENGCIKNIQGVKRYRFDTAVLREGTEGDLSHANACLALPEDTRTRAEALGAEIWEPEDNAQTRAEKIQSFVRSSARYNLTTRRMPTDETDFAMWFLENSDTGYCVHFASAAAVLLRAAGIPARYVTGYLTDCQPGETVTVQGKDAHAWVEYLRPGVGWVILEATPADLGSTEETPPPRKTEPSQPSDTPTQPEITPSDNPATPSGGAWWLLGIPAALGALALQYRLRLREKKRRRCRGKANARAMAIWREIATASRLLKEKPPADACALAQKAKYSQHILAESELAELESARLAELQKLREKPFPKRLAYRLIWALY